MEFIEDLIDGPGGLLVAFLLYCLTVILTWTLAATTVFVVIHALVAWGVDEWVVRTIGGV